MGNIEIKGTFTTPELFIDSEGVGNFRADNLEADFIKISSEGVGNVSCYASEYLKARSTGIGNITYYGNPAKKELSKDGIGRIKAGNK